MKNNRITVEVFAGKLFPVGEKVQYSVFDSNTLESNIFHGEIIGYDLDCTGKDKYQLIYIVQTKHDISRISSHIFKMS